ncbi:MAG: hypothetical protein ACOYX1_18255 [Acidobacteriota bacterium]
MVLAPLLAVSPALLQAGAPSDGKSTSVNRHLRTDSTAGDILRHPAFSGFPPLIFPWDDRAPDERMPLSRIASLLPYHTQVDPETAVRF